MIETSVLTQAVIDLFAGAFPLAVVMAVCATAANFAICLITGKERIRY